ncbi:MAG: hypothetical protein WAW10_07420 [Gallionella sp.]
MREQIEKYRLDMLRRLQQEDGQPPPPEVLEAQKVIAEFEERKRNRTQQLLRLQLPQHTLPVPLDGCPKCNFIHGVTPLSMTPIQSNTEDDLFKCMQCGFELCVPIPLQ